MDKILYNKILIISAIAITGSLIVFVNFMGDNAESPPGQSSPPPPIYFPEDEWPEREIREVSFPASDGYVLSATFWPSRVPVAKSPALILVHQYNSDRRDFSISVPTFQSNGYNVLTYDIRGFGKSKQGPTKLSDLPNDVIGAIDFLKQQPIVDGSKIGIVGSVFGAHIEWLALGTIPEIGAGVLLSPSEIGEDNVLSGSGREGFSPKNVLIVSSDRDKTAADFFSSRASDPKEQYVYNGYGRGVNLLKANDVMSDTLVFLNYYLKQ